MFNNPFGINSGGYTNKEDNFEIWYIEKEEDPRGYQTLDEIKSDLKKYNFIK